MQLQKAVEIKYIEPNKEETRDRQTYLEVSRYQKWYD